MRWVKVREYAPKQVAGVTYGNRQKDLRKCRAGTPVEFRREPHNTHDANAIALYARGRQIGYLPADVAEWVARHIDSGDVRYESRIVRMFEFEGDRGETILCADVSLEKYELEGGDASEPVFADDPRMIRINSQDRSAGASQATEESWGDAAGELLQVGADALRTAVDGTAHYGGRIVRTCDRLLERVSGGDVILLWVFRVLGVLVLVSGCAGAWLLL